MLRVETFNEKFVEKGHGHLHMSFPRKRESSNSDTYWTPAGVYPREGGGGSDQLVGSFHREDGTESWGSTMDFRKMNGKQVKDYLLTNWMTHDALWYREVATRFGMTEASPMNLRVCRSLGQIEFKRLLKGTGSKAPRDMAQLKELYEEAQRILVPPFMETEVDFQPGDKILFRTRACFAHKGMTEAGLIDDYECGIFERIKGWFDAMEVDYTLSPDLSRCLKFRGQKCHVTIGLHFKS